MAISKLMNYKEICKNIINVLEGVVDLKNTSFLKNDNLFYEMLRHIRKIQDKPFISLNNLSIENISFFMQILLDAFSICAATGSKNDDLSRFKLNNLKLLGGLKERRGKLLKTIDNQKIKDWLSCILLQGWINSNKEYPKLNVSDLEHDKRFKNSKKCDFKVDFDNKNFELIECKRIHPEKGEASFSEMIFKISNTIKKAVEQIKETEKILAVKSVCRTIFFDIASYNNNFSNIDKKWRITGFNEHEIVEIGKDIFVNLKNDGMNNKVDRIILTWKNIVFIDDIPVALIQNYYPIIVKPAISNSIDYKGWTIGLYTSNAIFKSIRVSSKARTLAWIKLTYFSLNDQLLTYGKEETEKRGKG
jgi:hypothetical protein